MSVLYVFWKTWIYKERKLYMYVHFLRFSNFNFDHFGSVVLTAWADQIVAISNNFHGSVGAHCWRIRLKVMRIWKGTIFNEKKRSVKQSKLQILCIAFVLDGVHVFSTACWCIGRCCNTTLYAWPLFLYVRKLTGMRAPDSLAGAASLFYCVMALSLCA